MNKWAKWLEPLKKWEWVALKEAPQWDEIQICVDELIEKKIIDVSIEKDIYAEYAHMKSVFDCMIPKWKEIEKDPKVKIHADRRWIEVFDLLQTKDLPIKSFAILVEYALTIPGKCFIAN